MSGGAGINDLVYIKHQEYIVVGVGPASADQKFWGKRKFILRKSGTSEYFFGYAKHITANMRLEEYNVEFPRQD